MAIRVGLAVAASLFVVACGNSGNGAAEAHGAGGAAAAASGTNWSDDTLNAAKVDYAFNSMAKLVGYAKAHPDVDMDKLAMDGSETGEDYARRIGADPQLRQVFTATGIDPVRYANVSGTLMGAMFGVGLAGKNVAAAKLPQAAQYYLAHKADIDARMQKAGTGG